MKKHKTTGILQLLFLFAVILIVLLPIESVSSAYFFSMVSFLISFFILKKYKISKDKRENIIAILLSIYYFIALSYRSILNSELCLSSALPSKIIIFYIAFPILMLLSSYINISYLISNRNNITKYLNKNIKINNLKKISLLIIIVLSVISFIGNLSLGSYSDINETLSWIDKGYWTHSHTISYEIYLFIFSRLFSLLGIFFVQGLLYVLINKYVLDIIEERFNNKYMILYMILNVLFFQPYVYNHLAPKDTIFSLCIFGLAASYFDILTSKKIAKKTIIRLFVFSILSCLLRHAAIIAVITALIISAVIYRKNKTVLRTFITCIFACIACFSFMTYFIGDFVLHAEKNEYYIKYTTPTYMIGSYMADGYEFDNIDELEKYISKDDWVLYYDKYWADTLSRKWFLMDRVNNMEKYDLGPVFLRTNLKMLLDNPFKYIVNLSHIDSILFEISTPVDGYDWAPISNHTSNYDITNTLSYDSFFNRLTNSIENISGEIDVVKDVLWRGGFYQFAYLVYIAIMILNKSKKKILILLPVIFIQLLLYISIPSQDPRYVLPMIIIYPLVTVLTFTKKDKIK